MDDLAKIIGARIRYYRKDKKWSQEKLAERAGCHAAYVGQVERGEKNMTLDSLMKFATALEVSLPQLLNGLGSNNDKSDTFLRFSEFFSMKSRAKQERLLSILQEIDKYKET